MQQHASMAQRLGGAAGADTAGMSPEEMAAALVEDIPASTSALRLAMDILQSGKVEEGEAARASKEGTRALAGTGPRPQASLA